MVTSQKERKIDRFFLLSFFLGFWSITWLSFFLGFWRPNLITGLSGWPPSLGNFVFLPLSTTDHPGHEEYGTHTNQDTRTDLTKAIAKIDAGVSTRDLIQESQVPSTEHTECQPNTSNRPFWSLPDNAYSPPTKTSNGNHSNKQCFYR